MRKQIILAFAMIALLSVIASAQKLSGVKVPDYVDKGSYMEVHANLRNNEGHKLNDAKLVIYVPELDIYQKTTGFQMANHVNYGRDMDVYIPQKTPSGEYLVRVSVFAEGKMKHQWRFVEVE